MYVVSSAVSSTPGYADDRNQPVIGINSVIEAADVEATSDDAVQIDDNLANPYTNLLWLSETSNPSIDFNVADKGPIDYIAIARHNFGSNGNSVTVSADSGGGHSTVISTFTPIGDEPIVCRFAESSSYDEIRLSLGTGTGGLFPTAAVVYVGKLLFLQRRIYVGHTPMSYGRAPQIVNGVSEQGNFLGRILIGETRQTSFNMANITPSWYRTFMDPFVEAAQTRPFFFAWRPYSYPDETSFAWLTNSAQPKNDRANGMMSIQLDLQGIA